MITSNSFQKIEVSRLSDIKSILKTRIQLLVELGLCKEAPIKQYETNSLKAKEWIHTTK